MTRIYHTITRRPMLRHLPSDSRQQARPHRFWLLGRFLDWCRCGPEHRDAELLLVTYALADTVRTHLLSARAVLPAHLHGRVDTLMRKYDVAMAGEIPDLPALLGIDAALNALYPPALAAKRAWIIRDRFQRVASRNAVFRWWLGAPPKSSAEGAVNVAGGHSPAPEQPVSPAAELAEAEADLATARDTAESANMAYASALQAVEQARQDYEQNQDDAQRADRYERAKAELEIARDEKESAAVALSFAQRYRDAVLAYVRLEARRLERQAAEAAVAKAEATQAANADDPGLPKMVAEVRDRLGMARNAEEAAERELDEKARAAGLDPKSIGAPVPVGADINSLLSYIHNNYLMGIAREKAERDLKIWLFHEFWKGILLTGAFLLLVIVVILLMTGAKSGIDLMRTPPALACFVVVLVGFLGRSGALFSIARRLQRVVVDNPLEQDIVHELVGLRAGRAGIRLALLSGTVFALLIWVLFASGVPALFGFGDGVFPTPRYDRQSAEAVLLARAEETVAEEALVAARGDLERLETQSRAPAKPDTPAPTAEDLAEARARLARAEADHQAARKNLLRVEETPDEMQQGKAAAADPASARENTLTSTAHWLGFVNISDVLLLLLWAFIAGFAERFVPDTLDRIIGRARRERESRAD